MKSEYKRKSFIVSIPKPCSEDWNEMKVVSGGKFCTHCQKTVVDFSNLTDTEIFHYFKTAQSIPCGRFHHSQLNINLHPQEQKHQSWKIIYRKAAALLAFLTLRNAVVNAQTKEPTTVQPAERKIVFDTTAQTVITISGIVKGEDGTALENVDISFNNKNIARTLADGSFSFETTIESFSKSSILKVSYPGLMAVARSYHPAMRSTSYNVVLEKPHFDDGFTGGAPVLYHSFAPLVFKQPMEINNEFRVRISEAAATFRNNPDADILLAAYGTTAREIKAAKKILSSIKTYFVEKEGINSNRFFTKIRPMQKGKQRTFDIEPYDPTLKE